MKLSKKYDLIIKRIMKGGINTLYDKALLELKEIKSRKSQIENRLEQLPEGKLICGKNEGRSKWYVSDGHNPVYLPKSEENLARQLSLKKYLTYLLDELTKEESAIEMYLRHHPKSPTKSEQYMKTESEYRRLLIQEIKPKSEKIIEWLKEAPEKKTISEEGAVIKCSSGNMVRSKSEAMIDRVLFENNIPFKYEYPLNIKDRIIHPDFTILHPHTLKIYYWEHFGLMDKESYCKNTYSKLELYSREGIIPTINLITTYETANNPLCYDGVEELVKKYFGE